MNPIRLAFLGGLEEAMPFVDAFDRLADEDLAEVVACAATDAKLPEALARRGPRVYADSQAMLAAETIDAALVAGSLPERYRLTRTLLEHGVHVITLPPVATVQEQRDLQGVQERSGVFCAVGWPSLALPATVLLKQRLCEGVLGPIRHVSGMSRTRIPAAPAGAWSGKLSVDGRYLLDGPFQGEGGEVLAVAAFLAGDDLHASACPDRVQAEVYALGAREAGDAACLRAEAHGVTLSVAATTLAACPAPPVWNVTGERGEAVLTGDGTLTILGETITPAQRDTGALVLLRRFVEVVLESDEPLLAPLGSLDAWARLMNGAYESSGAVHSLAGSRTLDDAVERAAMQGALFSESGVPGAVRTAPFALGAYAAFPSGTWPVRG